jgi:hypothetical protein
MKSNRKMPWLLLWLAPLFACALLSCSTSSGTPSTPPAPTFTSFDPQGSLVTVPTSINPAGAITGHYLTTGALYHGFLRGADGAITTFEVTGGGTGSAQGTQPTSINPAGEITGYYTDANSTSHGFLRAADGTITTFDVAGAGSALNQGTFAIAINATEAITGYYVDAVYRHHGFVRASNGTVTTFDGPLVFSISPNSVDPAGDITGQYLDGAGAHAFLRVSAGTIAILDVPGGASTSPLVCAYPCGPAIGSDGTIAGDYQGASQQFHGFLRAPDGTFTTFDAPSAGTGSNQGTFALAINTAGAITGYYLDANAVSHGFLRATSGTFTALDATGAGTVSSQGTFALSINPTGAITGYYVDMANVLHGFVWE